MRARDNGDAEQRSLIIKLLSLLELPIVSFAVLLVLFSYAQHNQTDLPSMLTFENLSIVSKNLTDAIKIVLP